MKQNKLFLISAITPTLNAKIILRFGLIPLLLHAPAGQAALTVTNIAQGSTAAHTLFLKSDGSLWGMGDNQFGQLGNSVAFLGNGSPFYAVNRPKQIAASGVRAMAVGSNHSLLLKSDGSLWTMGFDAYGQLGDGTFHTNFPYGSSQPRQIVAGGVTAIAAGWGHSLFIKSDGSLWGMGYNADGELGDGTFSNTNRPKQIVASGVTAIAAGDGYSLFLKSDGSLWGMGSCLAGALGDGRYGGSTNQPERIVASGVTAIAAGAEHSLFLKSDGSLWAMGDVFADMINKTNRPEQIVASGVTAIAAGYSHSLFLKSDGSLWGLGANMDGQLGGPNWPIVASGVTAIAAGGDQGSDGHGHSLFLKSDGSLWGMGANEHGQLGDGFTEYYTSDGDNLFITSVYIPEQIFPSPQPVLSIALSSQTDLQFNATCGFGGEFHLLRSADLSLPLSQWTPVWTNIITVRLTNIFSATITNAVNSGSGRFFTLQSQ